MTKRTEHQLKELKWKLHSHQTLIESESVDNELKKYIESIGYIDKIKSSIEIETKKIGITESRVINTGLPRYDKLRTISTSIKKGKSILIFPTWREWLAKSSQDDFEQSDFFKSYYLLLSNSYLLTELAKNGWEILFCLHTEKEIFSKSFKKLENNQVKIISGDIDFQELICKSEFLITDYSSLSWDFNALNKNVIFYHFDYEDYYSKRGAYVSDDKDWIGDVCYNKNELIESVLQRIKNNNNSSKIYDIGLELPDSCSKELLDNILKINKKIYFFVYNIYGVGGTVRTVTNFAYWLYLNGYDVEVISIRKTSKEPKMGLDPGIRITHFYDARRNIYKIHSKLNAKKFIYHALVNIFSKFKSITFHKDEDLYNNLNFLIDIKLIRKIIKLRNCVVIGTLPSLNFALSKWTHSTVSVIAQEHRYFDAHSRSMQDKIKRKYPLCDIVTVLTKDDKDVYLDKIGGQVEIIPNGTFCPNVPIKLQNKNIRMENEGFKIVCLGRYVPLKQVDLLISAASVLKNKGYNFNVDIYGHGELKEDLIQLNKSLGLEDYVTINGAVSDVSSIYQAADLCVLTSSSESFGMTIIEANAEAVPVVCFDIDYGPKELVENGENGLKAACFDYFDLADKVAYLIDNPSVHRKMCETSHERVKHNYSIEKASNNLREVIERLE